MLPDPLAPLASWPQFVAWRLEWNAERSKWDKIPYSPVPAYAGHKASSTNPAHWGTYDQAATFAAAQGMAGVGFVFTERDPFFFGDVDKALQPDGTWSRPALELCERFAGAAVEVSQSGTGLHIIGSYTGALPDHRNKNIPLGIELYTKERFVALTGSGAVGDASAPMDAALATVAALYFPPKANSSASAEWTTEPDAEWSGPSDDAELLARAMRSGGGNTAAAAFAGAEKLTFAALFNADAATLAAKWPSNSPGGDFDHSSADQALANQLAFWTGRDCERTERLMRMSALARWKWDDRPDYLQTTVLKGRQLVKTVYKEPPPAPPPPPPPTEEQLATAGFKPRKGGGIMGYADQLNHFKGCVYVSGPHKILTPRGERLDEGRFNAVFGGYEFVLAADGKKTTTNAWTAYTQAQQYTPDIADRLCFRPELGSGGIVEDAGLLLANTYVDVTTEATEGDVGPYLDLVAKQLPDPHDQEVLLTYMASCVQNVGLKAQWWPVIQGVKGNGKTLHLSAMVFCIGLRYCHMPNTDKMIRNGMNFNGWIDGKRFIGLEEVYAADRRSFFEAFKTTVTNRIVPIEAKGVEEATGDNRANGIITTNHVDGVPVDDDERRYAILFTAQQHKRHMARDGMTPRYFADLHDWFYGRGAYASKGVNYGARVINHYLRTRPLVAELDPAQLAINAPVTSSTRAAITASRGRVEQEVLEAIGEDRPGFAGGWISSIKLDDMLDRRKLAGLVPRNKRREMLRTLGYDWHPSLEAVGGRVNNNIQPDNGKPRLFCKVDSLAWKNITDPQAAAKAYSEAQAKAISNMVDSSVKSR